MKERNVLFNKSLNTFYLWLYDIGHWDHSDRVERRVLPFPIREARCSSVVERLLVV